jgi:hypothetical protein
MLEMALGRTGTIYSVKLDPTPVAETRTHGVVGGCRSPGLL